MEFKAEDIVRLHEFDIGLDRNALPLSILRAILKGWYEGGEVNLIKKFIQPGDKVLEMGGGIGITAMAVAKQVGGENIFSFELNPYLIDWSRYNFERNGLDITVNQCALMPEALIAGDTIDFHIHKNFWGSSLMHRPGTIETLNVPTASLEQTIVDRAANTLLIDIEGAETDLLTKADLSGINKIIMEIHYGIAGREATDAMTRHLVNTGFSVDLQNTSGGIVALYRDGTMAD